jgi:hypothetical protein
LVKNYQRGRKNGKSYKKCEEREKMTGKLKIKENTHEKLR